MSRRGRTLFDKQANLHFITTAITNHLRVFAAGNLWSNTYCTIIINNLKRRLKKHNCKLIAYVIMPSHLHFVLYTPHGTSVSDFMNHFKKFSSKDIKSRLYFDKKYDLIRIFKAASPIKEGHKIWQNRFDDYIITSEHMLQTKINYIHDNPRRAGLIKDITDWKYSSAKNYYLGDNSVMEVGFPED